MNKFVIHYPVKYAILTQPFGARPEFYSKYGIKGHNGLDYLTIHGQPVRAAHDGKVVYAGGDANEGIGVVIRTNEPYEFEGQELYFKSVYWHLVDEVLPVKVGQQVIVGDIIGHADNTGNSSGDHLHFAIKPQAKGENDWTWWNALQDNGYAGAIDPKPYFSGYYAEDIPKRIDILTKIRDLLSANLPSLTAKVKELLANKK